MYNLQLINVIKRHSHSLKLEDKVRCGGVYCHCSGPAYETRAECRALRWIGADVVGGSSAPEAAEAWSLGMHVVCFSVVTVHVLPSSEVTSSSHPPPDHESVLAEMAKVDSRIIRIVESFLADKDTHAVMMMPPRSYALVQSSALPSYACSCRLSSSCRCSMSRRESGMVIIIPLCMALTAFLIGQ